MNLKEGIIAPNFALKDQDNKEHKLSEYKGDWVLVYFYPKDDTTGCTKEACAIRDSFPNFKKLGLKVVGISVDSTKSHKKFRDKYDLPFTLLADVDKEVVNKYGIWQKKKFMGREYMGTVRTSFLINPSGKIAKIYDKVNHEIHAGQVLEDMKKFK